MRSKSKEQRAESKTKIVAILVIGLVAVIIISGCGRREAGEKPVITVSILPQKFLVEKIAGSRFDIQVMVPPGADSHTYEPSPGDVKNLSGSSLYFSMEYIDFELAWMERFRSINPRMKVAGLPDDLDLIKGEPGHQGIDPHLWLSPVEVRKIVRSMLQAIIQQDPEHAGLYRENYNRFMLEMDTLDQFLSQELASVRGKTVIIYHPALAYLARDYGFNQVSIEDEGKNPSAYHMKEVIELARNENIRNILIQKQIDRDMAKGVADEIGGQVVVIDPLAYHWLDNLREIARILNSIY